MAMTPTAKVPTISPWGGSPLKTVASSSTSTSSPAPASSSASPSTPVWGGTPLQTVPSSSTLTASSSPASSTTNPYPYPNCGTVLSVLNDPAVPAEVSVDMGGACWKGASALTSARFDCGHTDITAEQAGLIGAYAKSQCWLPQPVIPTPAPLKPVCDQATPIIQALGAFYNENPTMDDRCIAGTVTSHYSVTEAEFMCNSPMQPDITPQQLSTLKFLAQSCGVSPLDTPTRSSIPTPTQPSSSVSIPISSTASTGSTPSSSASTFETTETSSPTAPQTSASVSISIPPTESTGSTHSSSTYQPKRTEASLDASADSAPDYSAIAVKGLLGGMGVAIGGKVAEGIASKLTKNPKYLSLVSALTHAGITVALTQNPQGLLSAASVATIATASLPEEHRKAANILINLVSITSGVGYGLMVAYSGGTFVPLVSFLSAFMGAGLGNMLSDGTVALVAAFSKDGSPQHVPEVNMDVALAAAETHVDMARTAAETHVDMARTAAETHA